MAEEQQERTEQATAKRREEFRRRGQVAQSREVHTAALLGSALLLWFFYAPLFLGQLQSLLTWLLGLAGSHEVTPLSVQQLLLSVAAKVTVLLAPVVLLALLAGFASSYLQIGLLISLKPITPDLSRLDPVQGAVRIFSLRALVELAKSLAKVVLVGVAAFHTVEGEFAEALQLMAMEPAQTMRFLGRTAFKVLLNGFGVLSLLALLDFLYVRWEMERKMKMTRQELKEEFKETEGDPQLKARIRSLQASLARRRMMQEVPRADVVVTNPTHLAVALAYERGRMAAPRVVAKGADELARRIREVAAEHGVPLVENRPVARALYAVELGQGIPEELFKAVAEILAYVYRIKGKQA